MGLVHLQKCCSVLNTDSGFTWSDGEHLRKAEVNAVT